MDTIQEKKYIVYGLIDPRTSELRYIGKTHRTLKARLRNHIDRAKKETCPKVLSWIKGLLNANLRPDIFEIEEGFGESWREAEVFFISYYRSIGCGLLNMVDGGIGCSGYKHTESALLKIASINKGKKRPAYVMEAVRKANLGKKKSPEAREKMRAAWTPERRAKAAVTNSRKMSDEAKKKMSIAKLGKKRSIESIEKGAAKLRGRKQTAEQRKNSGLGIAKTWTPERRAKQAERFRSMRNTDEWNIALRLARENDERKTS